MIMPKFVTKNTLFEYFWTSILQNYCHIWNQHLQINVIAKFCKETKIPKFGYFWAKIFKKFIVRFEISTSKFAYLQNFTKKQECLNLGTKMSDLLCILELEFQNNISYLKSAPSNFSNCKKKKTWKCLNLGPKMAYFGILGLEF